MPAMDTDVEYSIGVNNRFGNLDFEAEDPSDFITHFVEKEPKSDKKGKNAKPAKGQEKTQQIHKKEVTIDDSRKDGFRHDKVDKADRRDRPDRAERGSGRGERSRGRGQRTRGRGRGGFNQDRDRNGEQTEERGGFDRPERGGFDRPERSGFGRFQDNREDRLDGEQRQSGGFPMEGDNLERGGYRRGGMGRGRGRDSGRGGRGRGRPFDRHSRSDRSSVKPTDKREGSGSFNWGTPQDELEASRESHQVFLTAEEEIKDWAEACEPQEVVEEPKEQGDEDGTQPPQEEAVKQMTLDEYKEMMEKERAKVTFNLRKANEGEKIQKDVKAIKKKNEEEEVEDGSLFFPRRLIEEKVKTSGRVREQLKLDLKYGESDSRLTGGDGRGRRRGGRRGGGGRGGPGRGRGGEEEGKSSGGGGFGSRSGFGPRSSGFGGGAADDSALNLESKDEFPSLS